VGQGRKGGVNKPLVFAFICLIAGILLGYFIKIPVVLVFLICAFFILFSIIIKNRSRILFLTAVLACVFCIGVLSFYNFTYVPPGHIVNLIQNKEPKLNLKGTVASDPAYYETHWGQRRAGFVFKTAQGSCKVILYKADKNYSYGDNLILYGTLKSPKRPSNPGEFDYSKYLMQQQIYAVVEVASDADITFLNKEPQKFSLSCFLKSKAYFLRQRINNHIHKYLPKDEAELFSAMTLGLRSQIPQESKDLFVQTGTAHILAISGLNLAIVAYILFFALGILRIPYNTKAFLVIVIICFYAILCGASPSVVRAAIMISFFLTARILNKSTDIYNILSLAGVIMLLVNPMQLFDAGFVLSFACIFALSCFTPKIENAIKINKKKRPAVYFVRILSASIAVYIITWPIVAYYFNIISPVTMLANLFVVPLAGLLICVGGVFILTGLLPIGFAASALGGATWLTAFLLEKLISYLAKIPYAYFYVPDISIWSVAAYYTLLFLAINRKKFKISGAVICIIALLFVNFYIWAPILKKEELKITFLDVAHGDAVFIQFPGGETALVDTGPKNNSVLQYIWHEGKTRIDAMVITHPHSDHFGGAVDIINKCSVRNFLHNGRTKGADKGYSQLLDLVASKSIKTFAIKEADKIYGLKDIDISVLNPGQSFISDDSVSVNDSSAVLKIKYKNINLLLCADVVEKGIESLVSYKELLKSDILKVPHHGSKTENYITRKFYELACPRLAIISATKNYRYRLPSEETLAILRETGSLVLVTDRTGAITIKSDGQNYTVNTIYRDDSI